MFREVEVLIEVFLLACCTMILSLDGTHSMLNPEQTKRVFLRIFMIICFKIRITSWNLGNLTNKLDSLPGSLWPNAAHSFHLWSRKHLVWSSDFLHQIFSTYKIKYKLRCGFQFQLHKALRPRESYLILWALTFSSEKFRDNNNNFM